MNSTARGGFDSHDVSSDENNGQTPDSSSRKRSSRACDQCRKCKSKCERTPNAPEGTPCKTCSMAGTACTFLGPSYKRGPPKGYIHAIEQRWHQVESLLGVLLQSKDPRVQSVINDLKRDNLACEILNRVDLGPYGPSGRSQTGGSTKEDFFASILRSNQSASPRDSARSKRQSRVSREIVSSTQDRGLSVAPTKEWQDQLSAFLDANSSNPSSPTYPQSSTSSTFDHYPHVSQRRKLEPSDSSHTTWENVPMYTMDDVDNDSLQDPTEAMGELSLDEQQELRFHGKTSGLHLIHSRTDSRHEGGIWRLPMARVWPLSKDSSRLALDEEDVPITLPPLHVQDELLQLYFTYVHPTFPVINKSRFMSEYHAFGFVSIKGSPDSGATPLPESTQKCTRLLLLAVFAVAARFRPEEAPLPPEGSMWEAGTVYMDYAISILNKIFHRSRTSTVQALLLLGHREFGIGSMEQAWIYIGMAIRMAMDLGLNCDSTLWKVEGHQLFSDDDTQTRRQIWWCCVIGDRYGSIYMGRPVVIKDSDMDVQPVEVHPDDERQLWKPLTPEHARVSYAPVPSCVMSSLSSTASLALILGDIVTFIYPVGAIPGTSRRSRAEDLERRLDRWYLELPDYLRYDVSSKRALTPPPAVLILHVRYWGSVLLLHRAFIPNWKGLQPTTENSTRELRAFDLAQVAATHITSIISAWRDTFSLKCVTPFLTSYLLNAGYIDFSSLVALRPDNPQATHGLDQTLLSLEDMKLPWSSAARALELLKGVKLRTQPAPPPSSAERANFKRHAEDAFGQEGSPDYSQLNYESSPMQQSFPRSSQNNNGVQDLNSRIMAQMLGLDIPGVHQTTSTSFLPGYGYEWWP
ncbi:fungal-specific transcription factor domain-containing protein, partial [Flagelloscypha sp. PMI_526]